MRSTRVGWVALVLAAIVLTLWRRGESAPDPSTQVANQVFALSRLSQDLRDVRVRWTALAERDSALARIAGAGRSGVVPNIWVQGFSGKPVAEWLQAGITRIWAAIPRPDTSVAVALLLYDENSYIDPSWRSVYRGNLITRVNGTLWCVAIVGGHLGNDGRPSAYKWGLDDVLGPCATLAAFGPPGPAVGEWLTATRYAASRSSPWVPLFSPAQQGAPPWQWVELRSLEEYASYAPAGKSLIVRAFGSEIAMLRAQPYHFGAPGLRCLDGHAPACLESVVRPAIRTANDPAIPSDLTGHYFLRALRTDFTVPRPPAGSFLSALAEEQGREKFQAFWTSGLPIEQAFERSFGVSLGDWTARWARSMWERTWEAHYRNQAIHLGVELDSSWPLLVVAWGALALLLVTTAVRRRQVT